MPALQVPRKLPRGVNSLPQEVVLVSQRARIVEGTAHAVAGKGYADTTVADIIAFAGVSRTTFYQLFRDKESCFLACFQGLADAHHHVVEEALARPAPHGEKLMAALSAYMERIDGDPSFARAFIGEAESATPAIRDAFGQARSRLERSLRDWLAAARREHPEIPAASASALELVNAGLGGYVVQHVRAGRALVPQVPEMAAFVFGALGMPRWAEHARTRRAG